MVEEGPRFAFIGNSLLFTNDIPGMAARLSHLDGSEPFASADFSQPGWPLIWHLERGTVEQLSDHVWSGIVIQEQSWESLHAPERARSSIGLLTERLRPVTDRIFLMESSIGTWSTDERLRVSELLRKAAVANQITLIPVASLWQNLSTQGGPSNSLPSPYGHDNHHPSEFGSFSAAAAILQAIRGSPLRQIPCEISRQPQIVLDAIVRRNALTLSEPQCSRLLEGLHLVSRTY